VIPLQFLSKDFCTNLGASPDHASSNSHLHSRQHHEFLTTINNDQGSSPSVASQHIPSSFHNLRRAQLPSQPPAPRGHAQTTSPINLDTWSSLLSVPTLNDQAYIALSRHLSLSLNRYLHNLQFIFLPSNPPQIHHSTWGLHLSGNSSLSSSPVLRLVHWQTQPSQAAPIVQT
jgi:hypothetical protein